jgi:phage protein D
MSTPAFRIVADGTDITDRIRDRLISLRITDQAGQQSDSLEVTIDDRDKRMEVPRYGAWLRVWLGYSAGGQKPAYMGAYAVDDVDLSMGPRSMVIRATAAQTAPELVKESRTQSWDHLTLGQIVQEIGKRNGLQVVVKGDLASVQIQHEDQTNETDQGFLTRLAERYGATIKPADGKLVVVPRGQGGVAGSATIRIEEVSSCRATLKGRGAYGGVKARWIDRATNQEKVVTAGESSGALPVFEEKQLHKTEAEAEKAAAARLQSFRSGEVRVNLQMQGRPDVNAEGSITLVGFRPEVDGTWQAKTITHELAGGGYTTSVDCGTEGSDNDEWTAGQAGGGIGMNGVRAGANNGRPASEKARLVAQAAERARGMNTRGGPDGGNNACVYAVNKVLRSAGITPPWGTSNYVPTARAALAGGAGIQLAGPEPGAIVILRDNGSPPYPHIGIVGTDGRTIISNSSSRGSFSWAAGESSYFGYYGRSPEYWRLR